MKTTWQIWSPEWREVNARRTDRTITPDDRARGLVQEIHATSYVNLRDAIDEQDHIEEGAT